MQTKTLNILSIVPGSKYLGVAILIDSELRDWFIKSIPNVSIGEKAEYIKPIISEIIERFNIKALALKKLHPARQSKNLTTLVARLKEIAKELNIAVLEYPIQTIEKFLIKGKLNKKRLAEMVTHVYPIVMNEHEKEKQSKFKYYTRMFEAIALGMVCFNRLDSDSKREK